MVRLARILAFVTPRSCPKMSRLFSILDTGNAYAEHVRGAHAALREWQETKPLSIGSLTFDDDEDVSALQGSNVVAWSVRRRITGSSFGNGFELLLGIFNEAHSETSWDGALLEQVATAFPYPAIIRDMKPATEMHEGPEAFERFRTAMKEILTVPKSALPPSPFKKWVPKKKASRSRKS